MHQTKLIGSQLILVGISCRTNTANELDPATAKIGGTLQRYMQDQVANAIVNRKQPGTTYCVYTEYESDLTGDYTYFVGEEVTNSTAISGDLEQLIIPVCPYVKFTTELGNMPGICISAWQNIWAMDAQALGGERAYEADFEVYDTRAIDPKETVLDIYIGLKA